MTERTLLVLRHSKSAYPEGTADVDRPLSDRGRRDAAKAGGWLRDQGYTPDLVVCSTAERTIQTWDLVSDQLGWTGDEPGMVRYDPRVYEASPGDLLTVVQETPEEVSILALVGHNPGSAELVLALAGAPRAELPHLGAGRHRAARRLARGRAGVRDAGDGVDAQGRVSRAGWLTPARRRGRLRPPPPPRRGARRAGTAPSRGTAR